MPPEIKVKLTGEEIIKLLLPELGRRVLAAGHMGKFDLKWAHWTSRDLPPIPGQEYPPGLRPLACDIEITLVDGEAWRSMTPVDLVIHCPACGKQHLDIGEFQTRVHRKHLCENTTEGEKTGCGHLWVPFQHPTRGVEKV